MTAIARPKSAARSKKLNEGVLKLLCKKPEEIAKDATALALDAVEDIVLLPLSENMLGRKLKTFLKRPRKERWKLFTKDLGELA